MAPLQVSLPVNNYSAGRTTRVRILTLHDTEGARTMESLAAFQRRMGNSSYHAGSDDQKIAYMVNRRNKAWHCRNGNPMMDGFVLCGFARWSRGEWLEHPVMLENTSWWLASCARERGLPLVALTPGQVRAAVRDPRHPGGVCMHWDYSRGTGDGTHWDNGGGFPMDLVLARARDIQRGQAGLPTTPPNPGTVPLKRKDNDLVQNFPITGKGSLKLNCPVGKSSAVTAQAWLSASLIDGTGHIKVWAQDDDSGVNDWAWQLEVHNGRSDRPWADLVDGTTQLAVHYDLTGSGVLTLETLAK